MNQQPNERSTESSGSPDSEQDAPEVTEANSADADEATHRLSDSTSDDPIGRPYVCACAFCGNGLVRLHRCSLCQSISAICDECELLWSDPNELSANPNLKTDDSFPACPSCQSSSPEWPTLTRNMILEAGLESTIHGISR